MYYRPAEVFSCDMAILARSPKHPDDIKADNLTVHVDEPQIADVMWYDGDKKREMTYSGTFAVVWK